MRRIFFLIGLIVIILGACAAPALPQTPLPPPATYTPFIPSSPTFTATLAPTVTPSSTPTLTPTPLAPIDRVLIISVDGLRPDAISLAPMPVLQGLMEQGAYTLHAQTIHPSSTLPSHASMTTGLCPDQHGVDWNDYIPERGFAQGKSIFEVAHNAGLKTVMLFGKRKFVQLAPPENLDISEYISDGDTPIAQQAAAVLVQGFDLALVHFPNPDGMGHEYGWLSDEQLSVLRRTDFGIGAILGALNAAGMSDSTLVIITADHGGHDTSHGSSLPEDMTIPWIAVGPRIIHQEITQPINTTDTAATALWALHLPLQPEMAGRAVSEAFGEAATIRIDPRCP